MNDRKWRGDNEKIRRKKRQALNALLVNIADSLSEQERESIAQVCLEDFRSDMESRTEWDAMHADWVAVYNQQDAPINRPWPNSSDESLGLLTEACNSFQSRAYKAFFASRMPVAAISTNPSIPGSSERAKRVSQFLQWSLFFKDQTYKEDKSAMLLRVAVHGSDFTKTYFDPVMNKIVTRAVRAEDLYVPYHIGPINIEDVHRKTELIHINLNEGRIRASEGYFLSPPEPMMIGQLSSPIQSRTTGTTASMPLPRRARTWPRSSNSIATLTSTGTGSRSRTRSGSTLPRRSCSALKCGTRLTRPGVLSTVACRLRNTRTTASL